MTTPNAAIETVNDIRDHLEKMSFAAGEADHLFNSIDDADIDALAEAGGTPAAEVAGVIAGAYAALRAAREPISTSNKALKALPGGEVKEEGERRSVRPGSAGSGRPQPRFGSAMDSLHILRLLHPRFGRPALQRRRPPLGGQGLIGHSRLCSWT
jgi:hypothetical protein